MKHFLILTFAMALAVPASAAIVVDGTKDAAYGSHVSVQTVQTQFGDNESEWNAAYGQIADGKLSLMLTGNLQATFNKLEIFIDSKAGGQTTFDSSDNDGADSMDGTIFDTGFTPEYHLIARRGSSKFDLDFADLGAQTFGAYYDVFGGNDFGAGTTDGTPDLGTISLNVDVGYNGSNTAGIGGGTAALLPSEIADALLVTTGLELSIDLADIGYTGGDINVLVGQNNGGHDYFSNQFLGGLPGPQPNLEVGVVDFTAFTGDQFFTISPVPEPTTGLLALLAVTGMTAIRRK